MTIQKIKVGTTEHDLVASKLSMDNSDMDAVAIEILGSPGSVGITKKELAYLDGVTSRIQSQLNDKSNTGHTHAKLVNSVANDEILFVYDNSYLFLRPENLSTVLGSTGYNWYNTYTSKLTVSDVTTVSARIVPYASSQVNLGLSDRRWMNIYSNSALNVSSDLKLKTDLAEIDDRYIELFDLVQPYAYKFIDGTSGRVHTGFISQYVEDAMQQVGLEPEDLAFFCKDAMFEEVTNEIGDVIEKKPILDEDGNQQYYYSLRYEEYIAIMVEKMKRMEKRIDELETKLEKVDEIEARLAAIENV